MLKRTILAGMFFLFLGAVGAYAQFPAEGINYQAVARNAQGNVISTPITVRISVLSGSPTGTLQYQETHNTTPNSLGLFNLSIGQGVFSGGAVNNFASISWDVASHYAKTEINTGSGFTDMGTTQLWAVPYALYAKNAGSGGGGSYTAGSGISIAGGVISAVDNSVTNEIQTLAISGSTLSISGGNNITLPSGSGGGTLDQAYDFGGLGAGKIITADSGPVTINGTGAGAANIGLLLTHNGSGTSAMGINFSGTGTGIQAISTNAANTFATIQASSNSSTASNSAILGQSTGAARAVTGQVEATATADAAVRGLNSRTNGGIGIDGVGFNGVSGSSGYNQGFGVFATNTSTANVTSGFYAVGVAGLSTNGVGVQGQTTNGQLPAILGQNLNTGIVYNNIGVYGQSTTGIGVYGESTDYYGVFSAGDFGASGVKTFLIDHPLDPTNKFLKHFSIESNEVLNIYRGTVVCDANGEATVAMPTYVEAVNKNYSYQLTPIGSFAGLFIKEKLSNGQFKIAGAQPNMEVSWELVGERNDAYLVKYPEKREVEVEKKASAKGTYISPELYGKSNDLKMINFSQEVIKTAK